MVKYAITAFCLFIITTTIAQQTGPLTVAKIMRDPKWIGTSPSSPNWSQDSKTLYFLWNPGKAPSDSLYYISNNNLTPIKARPAKNNSMRCRDTTIIIAHAPLL